jgi:hypothetical protein
VGGRAGGQYIIDDEDSQSVKPGLGDESECASKIGTPCRSGKLGLWRSSSHLGEYMGGPGDHQAARQTCCDRDRRQVSAEEAVGPVVRDRDDQVDPCATEQVRFAVDQEVSERGGKDIAALLFDGEDSAAELSVIHAERSDAFKGETVIATMDAAARRVEMRSDGRAAAEAAICQWGCDGRGAVGAKCKRL